MKKVLVLLAVLMVWQQWDRIEPLLSTSNTPAVSTRPGEVVLYATSWCGYCAKTRTFLEQQNIPYRELDIEKSASARKAYDAHGGRGVPLIDVKGQLISGYNPQAILAAY